MTLTFLVYVVFGKLFVYAIPKFPPAEWLVGKLHLEKLIECGFCLGTWVYFVFAFLFPVEVVWLPQIPIVHEFLLAVATSFVVNLLSVGWNDQFSTIVIGD